jgi:hypothetical protein
VAREADEGAAAEPDAALIAAAGVA